MKILHLDATLVTDLSPLSELDRLVELNLGLTAVEDVAPPSSLENQRFFDLSATNVHNVSPLSTLKKLREIRLQGSGGCRRQQFEGVDKKRFKNKALDQF